MTQLLLTIENTQHAINLWAIGVGLPQVAILVGCMVVLWALWVSR